MTELNRDDNMFVIDKLNDEEHSDIDKDQRPERVRARRRKSTIIIDRNLYKFGCHHRKKKRSNKENKTEKEDRDHSRSVLYEMILLIEMDDYDSSADKHKTIEGDKDSLGKNEVFQSRIVAVSDNTEAQMRALTVSDFSVTLSCFSKRNV